MGWDDLFRILRPFSLKLSSDVMTAVFYYYATTDDGDDDKVLIDFDVDPFMSRSDANFDRINRPDRS